MASLTDFKVSRRTVDNRGVVTEVLRFFEGDIITEDELNPDTGRLEPVTRYRRVGIIRRPSRDIDQYTSRLDGSQLIGNDWELTYKRGVDEEDTRRRILNEDTSRTPIDEQKTSP
jgi:hypothetical protein